MSYYFDYFHIIFSVFSANLKETKLYKAHSRSDICANNRDRFYSNRFATDDKAREQSHFNKSAIVHYQQRTLLLTAKISQIRNFLFAPRQKARTKGDCCQASKVTENLIFPAFALRPKQNDEKKNLRKKL